MRLQKLMDAERVAYRRAAPQEPVGERSQLRGAEVEALFPPVEVHLTRRLHKVGMMRHLLPPRPSAVAR